jgi:hypothetical protein
MARPHHAPQLSRHFSSINRGFITFGTFGLHLMRRPRAFYRNAYRNRRISTHQQLENSATCASLPSPQHINT